MTTTTSKQAESFLSSMDMRLPMIYQFKVCMRDALTYKWSSSIVIEIMSGIEDAYKAKK
jgi:hypothetical protein